MTLVTPVYSASDPAHPLVCGFRHASGTILYNADVTLTSVTLGGSSGSADPTPFTVGMAFDPLDGSGSYPADALVSDPLSAAGSASYWVAGAGPDHVGTLNTCTEECTFTPIVEINDTARAAAGTCAEYANVEWCPDFIETDARRRIPLSSTCEAGSGTFSLVPMKTYNKDGDSSITAIFRPVMTTGSGRLTAAAWITQARAVQAEGQSIAVIKANRDYHIGSTDMLDNPSLVSRAVPSTVTSFPLSSVAGNAPFIVQEAPRTMPLDLQVALTWTCGSYQSNEERNTDPGFTFRLSDVGCSVAWPQVFTMRVYPALAPTRVEFSLYGSMTDVHTAPITMVGNERRFRLQEGDLSLAGALLSWGGSGAVVRMDSVTWAGASLCTGGTYTLPAEE